MFWKKENQMKSAKKWKKLIASTTAYRATRRTASTSLPKREVSLMRPSVLAPVRCAHLPFPRTQIDMQGDKFIFHIILRKSPICWVRRQCTAHRESAPRIRSFFNLSFLSGERVALTFISNGGDPPTDKGITVQAKVKGVCVVDVCVCARAHNSSFVCAIYMTIYMTYIYIAICMIYIYIAHTALNIPRCYDNPPHED